MNYLEIIIDTAEVWAILIPLAVLISWKNQPQQFKPVIIYLWVALVLDVMIVIGHKVGHVSGRFFFPNGYLYNIHSILRYSLFVWFFALLKVPLIVRYQKVLAGFSILFVWIIFLFFDQFYDRSFSAKLLSTEAGLLLVYSLQYFLHKQTEEAQKNLQPEFWIVLGLSIYGLYNFLCFLFFNKMFEDHHEEVGYLMWRVHNLTFIIFCLFIAKSFYGGKNK